MTLLTGFGRASITVYEPGTCTFGWGDIRREIRGVSRELFARALVIEEQPGGRRLAYVCCDLGMISESLRAEVVRLIDERGLGVAAQDLMITATHTHSGPTGFSRYLLYICGAPGFSTRVHDALAAGVVASLAAAVAALTPSRLHVHAAPVALGVPIAWNRSIEAYSQNRDVSPLPFERRDEAVDRTMTVLRADTIDGRPLGLVSWFAVHGTSMHADNQLLHGDNKGEAARCLEERARLEGNPGYVAIFAQAAAGDVSPNYRLDRRRGIEVGRYDDDHASALFSGEAQAAHALVVAAAALRVGTPVERGLDARIATSDFFAAPVDPAFVFGREGLRTGPPRLGVHFACGTPEGPGPLGFAPSLSRALTRAMALQVRVGSRSFDDRLHGAKPTFIELAHGGRNRFLGLVELPALLLMALPHRHLSHVGRAIRETEASYQPWVPRYLPAQLMQIGPLVLAGMPNEPTTVAGRRIAAVVQRGLGRQAQHVVVNGYANAYAGYVTTPEEYAVQCYEGASTLFGDMSLPAWCTAFAAMIVRMRADARRVPELASPVV
jgi:neutral ceramidase